MQPSKILLPITLGALTIVSACKKPEAAKSSPPPAIPPTQVVAVEARREAVAESLSLVGTLTANEWVEIKAELEAAVVEIGFDEGKPVQKGQLLFRLDESKLTTALTEAEVNLKLSKANYDRAQQLFRDKTISQQEFDQLASRFESMQAAIALTQRELQDTKIFAPVAGGMGARNVSSGQVIKKDTVLGNLVDLNPVKVEVNVPERFLSLLKLDQTIELRVAAFPGRSFKGQVYFIAPQVDTTTRTALVKAKIANADGTLKPGMFANLDLTLQLRDAAVVVPEPAIIVNADKAMLDVVDKDMNAQLRFVKLGVRSAGVVEILSGVDADQLVIVEGVQKVRPGAKVKPAGPEAAAVYQRQAGEKVGKRESEPPSTNGSGTKAQ
ncbi:MAG: efflux RND transporter periplasmic adaptor subunit [Limisphaerales bacterium]